VPDVPDAPAVPATLIELLALIRYPGLARRSWVRWALSGSSWPSWFPSS